MGGNSDEKYSLKSEHKRKNEEQFSLKLDTKNRRSRSSSDSSSANHKRRAKSKHSKKRSESHSSSCISSSDVEDRKLRRKSKHKKFRSTSSRDSDVDEKVKRKMEKKKAKKLLLKRKKTESTDDDCNDVPLNLMEKSTFMAPMTKEEWEKKQSVIRRVYDQESGRYRLIKGDGEIIEEIVSRDRHKEINQQATHGDGHFFQSKISSSLTKF